MQEQTSTKTTNVRNIESNIITNPTDMKKIFRQYYEQIYDKIFENIDEMGKFLHNINY